MNFSCTRSHLRNWSRETGLTVLSRERPIILYTQAESGTYLRVPLCHFAFRDSGPKTVSPHQVSPDFIRSCADSAHRREFVGTGLGVLKVALLTGAVNSYSQRPIKVCSSFSTPTTGKLSFHVNRSSNYQITITRDLHGITFQHSHGPLLLPTMQYGIGTVQGLHICTVLFTVRGCSGTVRACESTVSLLWNNIET